MDELAKRFADLAEKYGPTVADAAMAAARVEAFSTVAAGLLCLAIASAMLYGGYRLAVKILRDDWDEITWLPAGLLLLIGGCVLCAGLWPLIDPWTWTAMSHPEIWIAKRAFKL